MEHIQIDEAERPYETVGDVVKAEYKAELSSRVQYEIAMLQKLAELIKRDEILWQSPYQS